MENKKDLKSTSLKDVSGGGLTMSGGKTQATDDTTGEAFAQGKNAEDIIRLDKQANSWYRPNLPRNSSNSGSPKS